MNFRGFALVLCDFAIFRMVDFWGTRLTQAVTHMGTRSGNHRKAPERKLSTAFAADKVK